MTLAGRRVGRVRRSVALAAALGLMAVILSLAAARPAGAQVTAASTSAGCRSYPHPGTTAAGGAPANLRAEYRVLDRPRGSVDQIALQKLGPLPESGILAQGIRYLGGVPGDGRAYMVPALHLLASALEPARCLPASQRPLQRALLPTLRSEYAGEGLCLVIVYTNRSTPNCQSAPDPFDGLLSAPGTPGVGIAPDGVPAVELHFRHHAAIRAPVRANFWVVSDPKVLIAPCGLDWITAGGIVLRTVASCQATDQDG